MPISIGQPHVVFVGEVERVDCPTSDQTHLRCKVQAEKSLGIEVRAGLHTGECEMIDDDVGGSAVHIGARVAAIAGAGEVSVSSTVNDLVAGSGLRFLDRGSHSLKGVSGEWRIFAVGR